MVIFDGLKLESVLVSKFWDKTEWDEVYSGPRLIQIGALISFPSNCAGFQIMQVILSCTEIELFFLCILFGVFVEANSNHVGLTLTLQITFVWAVNSQFSNEPKKRKHEKFKNWDFRTMIRHWDRVRFACCSNMVASYIAKSNPLFFTCYGRCKQISQNRLLMQPKSNEITLYWFGELHTSAFIAVKWFSITDETLVDTTGRNFYWRKAPLPGTILIDLFLTETFKSQDPPPPHQKHISMCVGAYVCEGMSGECVCCCHQVQCQISLFSWLVIPMIVRTQTP